MQPEAPAPARGPTPTATPVAAPAPRPDWFRIITGVIQIAIAVVAGAIALGWLPAQPELIALLLGIQNALQGTRHVAPTHEPRPTNGTP